MKGWTWKKAKALFVEAYNDWNEDEAPRMGAALAYYTVLSLAPLLVIAIAIAGLLLGREAAQGELMGQISDLVGTEGAKAIEGMIAGARSKEGGVIASVLGGLTLLWGASAVVGELRDSLNKVWDHKAREEGVTGTIKQKSKAMGMVLGFGFLLLVSLAVSAGISTLGKMLTNLLPLPEVVMHGVHLLASLAVFTLVFAVMFRFLPDSEIHWDDVVAGALFTALLFTVGKFLIGLYLGNAGFGSTYGAAGSLVIVLVWVYYSAQIFFFGAEVTHAYAGLYGSRAEVKRTTSDAPPKPKLDVSLAAGSAMLPPVADPPSKVTANAGAALGIGLAASRIFKVLRGR